MNQLQLQKFVEEAQQQSEERIVMVCLIGNLLVLLEDGAATTID